MVAMLGQLVDSMSLAHWMALAVILAVVTFRIAMEELLQARPGRGVARIVRRPAGRRSLPTRATRQARSRPRASIYLAKRSARHGVAPIERNPQQHN